MTTKVKRVQVLGGAKAALSSFIGRPREIIVDTTESTLTVHDGGTPGGRRMLPEDGDASQAVAGGRVLQDVAGAVAGLDVGSSTEVALKPGATLKAEKVAGGDATSVPASTTSLVSKTASASWVMSDYVITMSGVASYADVGATRSVARAFGAANGYANHTADTLIRAGEFQTLRGTGTQQTTQGGTWGVEIGVHSQVAGDGSSKNIGAYIASSHTGWLTSGTKADCGIKVCGEDGWYYYERFHDEADALKWCVKNNGDLYTAGAIGVGTTSPQTFAGYGTVCVNGTTGSFYDVNVNGSNKLRIQATSGGTYLDSAGSVGSIDFRSSGGANTNARLFDSGAVAFPRVGTTASAANAYLDNSAGNSLLRSTSSGVYKTDVETLDPQYADAVLSLRPVWYRSLADADRKDWSWYGLIAEEVAAIEPRLVHYRQLTKTVTRTVAVAVPVLEDYEDMEPAVEVIDGKAVHRLVPVTKQRQAVDVFPLVDEAGDPVLETLRAEVRDTDGNVLEPAIVRQAVHVVPRVATEQREVTEEVPDLDSAPIPDGVQYERLTVMLLDIARRLTDRITALEAQLAALRPAAE
ncbi:Chaperone of endosialidase [Azospirillum oryzae]|uniref:Chaperone of endosialidase n=1 Tax=Azospirillum oryzae TaxID=286727 RepID=A0A1X7F9B6_9PROT|nr:tail fiber domain-containing protein [Azospirillum oryzae]SMF48337.1 Chaperone of endosialidase [Azospirillum oryzae]